MYANRPLISLMFFCLSFLFVCWLLLFFFWDRASLISHGNKNVTIYLQSHWIVVIILSKRSRIYVIEIFITSEWITLQQSPNRIHVALPRHKHRMPTLNIITLTENIEINRFFLKKIHVVFIYELSKFNYVLCYLPWI